MTIRFVSGVVAVAMVVPGLAWGQDYPKPTVAQQAIIDKDISRHFGDSPVDGGAMAKDLSPALTAKDVDKAMKKVADWQLERAQPYFDRIWTWSVLYSGFMAASESTGDAKYREAMLAMSKKFNWEERSKLPNADDQSVGQTYLEFYLMQRDAERLTPTKAALDSVIGLKTLTATDERLPWWWCDALFMGAPVWSHMYRATGERKYVDYLDEQWKKTSELLYDQQEHLYARDAAYKTRTEANGRKMFWSRGNGWVMGGIARILDELPKDDPRRGFYMGQLKEMAARVAELQGSDGLWHAGLLDPKTYTLPEISGSAFFTYAIAFGIDHGILDAKTFRPVVEKAWRGILQHVFADGRLGCIQQTGSEPAFYMPTASYTYGVGPYLLAGAEIKTMLAWEKGQGLMVQTPSATDPLGEIALNLPVPKNPKLPTLFLVGDSTVRNGHGDGAQGQWGWGEPLVTYFDAGKVNVVNRAIGGRSSRTYITEGHWAEVLGMMKAGDTVLLQFGHNDSGPLDDGARARGTIPGVGEETREIENPILKRHETVHSYGWYMDEYVREAKAKGATVIVCSPIPRKIWKDGKVERNSANYGGWSRAVAEKEGVGFIDLDEMIAAKYDEMGEARVEGMFADPHTHTSLVGAELNAESVVEGLKRLKTDPVGKDFSAKGKAVK